MISYVPAIDTYFITGRKKPAPLPGELSGNLSTQDNTQENAVAKEDGPEVNSQ